MEHIKELHVGLHSKGWLAPVNKKFYETCPLEMSVPGLGKHPEWIFYKLLAKNFIYCSFKCLNFKRLNELIITA